MKRVVQIIKNELSDVKLIYLFGSRANGLATKKSDMDIAFLSSKSLKNLVRWELQEKIARQLNMDIDLVDMSLSTDIFLNQIIANGVLYFENEKGESLFFESRIMARYLDIQELIRASYDDAFNTGKILM